MHSAPAHVVGARAAEAVAVKPGAYPCPAHVRAAALQLSAEHVARHGDLWSLPRRRALAAAAGARARAARPQRDFRRDAARQDRPRRPSHPLFSPARPRARARRVPRRGRTGA